MTCAHVLDGATPLGVVLADGGRADVEVIAVDTGSDLALLSVAGDGPYPFLSPADREPTAGERVWTATKDGLCLGRLKGRFVDQVVGEASELTTSLGPGASGGAVVDVRGRLVAVIRGAVDDDAGQTVAIPGRHVRSLLAQSKPSDEPG